MPSKALIIFPIASELGSLSKHDELIIIYRKMARYIFNINMFITLLICLFSWEIMVLWMGEVFAEKAAFILLTVSIGYLFNTTTGLSSLMNDGIGHPKVTSIFAFIHGAVAVLMLISFGSLYSLNGIAIGYSVSSMIMAVIFNTYVHTKVIRVSWREIIRTSYLGGILFLALIAPTFILLKANNILPEFTITVLIFEVLILTLLYLIFAYLFVLDKDDKLLVVSLISKMTNRKNNNQRL